MSIVRFAAYPGTIITSLLVFATLNISGVPLVLGTYAGVFTGIVLIIILEQIIPYRREWRPSLREFTDDAGYALVVQVLLPRLLGIGAVLLFANQIEYATRFWPHDWPVAVQVILMMLAADFLRYWLHIAFHNIPAMWRLHEVHHSPARLYWLNTSRFHPLEKAVQFVFDALPFILLGVSEQVLAVYFVFYAVNGFFQHSNVNVRMGFLNYIISSPQLHRWHHSKIVSESNSNYGNNLIVWDVLFGTRFLPKDRSVEQLGTKKQNYPAYFLGQLLAPFQKLD